MPHVTCDDSQSQSGAGWRAGARGRELIRGPGVTSICFLSISHHPATLFLPHGRPARLENSKPLHRRLSPHTFHHSDYLLSMHPNGGPVQRNRGTGTEELVQPFGVPKADRCLTKKTKQKKNTLSLRWRGHVDQSDNWGKGMKRRSNSCSVER